MLETPSNCKVQRWQRIGKWHQQRHEGWGSAEEGGSASWGGDIRRLWS